MGLKTQNNIIVIQKESDFPDVVGGYHILEDNISYFINGTITMSYPITLGISNFIQGEDKSNDQLIYIGSGSFINGNNKDFTLADCTVAITTTGASLFNITGTTNKTEIRGNILASCKSLGIIDGGSIFALHDSYITLCSEGITIKGTFDKVAVVDNIFNGNSSTITCISVPSGTFTEFKISRQLFDISSGQTALNISASTIVTLGIVELCDFTGAGAYLSGVNYLNPIWSFRVNRGISNSITLQPRMNDRNFFAVRAGNATRKEIGVATSAFALTAAQSNDNTTSYTSYTSSTSSGSYAGIESAVFTEFRSDNSPIFSAVIKTDSTITNVRYWIGLFSATLGSGDDQSGAYAGFRFSTVAGDAGWTPIVDTGSVNTAGATIGTVTASTQYKFDIQVDFINIKTYFRVNGGAWTVINSVPPTGTGLGFCVELTTTTTSARTLYFSRLDGNYN